MWEKMNHLMKIGLNELQTLTEKMLISRELKTAPGIFICLGHQLAAQAHIKLLKKATQEVLKKLDPDIFSISSHYQNLIETSKRIISVGENLNVYKIAKKVAQRMGEKICSFITMVAVKIIF